MVFPPPPAIRAINRRRVRFIIELWVHFFWCCWSALCSATTKPTDRPAKSTKVVQRAGAVVNGEEEELHIIISAWACAFIPYVGTR